MTFNDYQKEALRTAGPKCRDLINTALGLCGETAEFIRKFRAGDKKETLAKELGDIAWYAEVANYVLQYNDGLMSVDRSIDLNERQSFAVENILYRNKSVDYNDLIAELSILSGTFADIVKKHYFQGKKLDSAYMDELLYYIMDLLAVLFWKIGYTFEEGLQINVNKLRRRYPDGFMN